MRKRSPNSNHHQKQQSILTSSSSNLSTEEILMQYMCKLTGKLSNTFRELNELSEHTFKIIQSTRNKHHFQHHHQNIQKKSREMLQKQGDLNDNLILEGNQKYHQNNKRKIIQEAEEEQIEMDQGCYMQENYNKNYNNGGDKKGKRNQNHGVDKKSKLKDKYKQKPEDWEEDREDHYEQKNQIKMVNQDRQSTKKPAKQISHKPKAPTSSFLLFFKQQQHSISKSYPNYGVVQLTKVAAKCWNQLSITQKQPYQKLFQIQRRKYQQDMQKYRKEFPQEVKQNQLQKKQRKKLKAQEKKEKEKQTGNVQRNVGSQLGGYQQKPRKTQNIVNQSINVISKSHLNKQKQPHLVSSSNNNNNQLKKNPETIDHSGIIRDYLNYPTPGEPFTNNSVKLEHHNNPHMQEQQKEKRMVKIEQVFGQENGEYDALGSLDGDEEIEKENSLGEDI